MQGPKEKLKSNYGKKRQHTPTERDGETIRGAIDSIRTRDVNAAIITGPIRK